MDDTATVSPNEDLTTVDEVELRRKWEHCVYVAQTIAYRLTDEDRKASFLARYSAEEGEIEWRNWRIRANDKRRWTEHRIRTIKGELAERNKHDVTVVFLRQLWRALDAGSPLKEQVRVFVRDVWSVYFKDEEVEHGTSDQ